MARTTTTSEALAVAVHERRVACSRLVDAENRARVALERLAKAKQDHEDTAAAVVALQARLERVREVVANAAALREVAP